MIILQLQVSSVSVSINPWDTDGNGIPDIERACIKAWTLNASSSSLCCTEPLRFSFSENVNDTIRCFDCFDVGVETIVQLWVHDCNGNTDYVDVNIEVQDNNQVNVCETVCEQHPAIPVITGNNIICDGNSTTLTASGGVIYKWSTGATTLQLPFLHRYLLLTQSQLPMNSDVQLQPNVQSL